MIANSCGHPDCANTAEMLKQAMGDLNVAELRLKAAQDRAEDWHRVADGRSAEIIRLMREADSARSIFRQDLSAIQAENERLRAALAVSQSPCVYCSLPAEDWAKCQHGFPGCGRADDMMGCPELGARLENEQLRAELEALRAELAKGGRD